MAGEKKRCRLRRSRYVETLNQNQIPPTTPPQATLDQPSTSIDTDQNLDLDLRQTGSRSIDQPRSDPDSENRRSSRSPQRRPSSRSATSPQEADRPIRIISTLPLPPTPYIRQAASTLTPPTAPNHDNSNIVTHNIGGMTKTCHYYDAKLWPTETSSLCCANGQVNLPPLQTLPEPLHHLFMGDTAESRCRCFRNNIRSYNSAFTFATLGGHVFKLSILRICGFSTSIMLNFEFSL